MVYAGTWRTPVSQHHPTAGSLASYVGTSQHYACTRRDRPGCTCFYALTVRGAHVDEATSTQPLSKSDTARGLVQERQRAAESWTSPYEEAGTSKAGSSVPDTPHRSSVQHLLEQCDHMFQELSGREQTPAQLCASVQQLADWCEDVRWPGPQALLRHRLAQHITFTIPYYLPDFQDEETVALMGALMQLDKQNVSSDVQECLQHVHSSFAERGCSCLPAPALCSALTSYASSLQLQRSRGHIITDLVKALLPLTDQLTPSQQCSVAADLCWLKQDRTHRGAITSLFSSAVKHAPTLSPYEIGRLFNTARSLGRMPEQEMQELAQQLPAAAGQLSALELVTVEDALFRSGLRDKSLLRLLDKELIPKIDSLGERQLSRSMYVFASMGFVPSTQLLAEVERLVLAQPHLYSCRSLSTLLWAFVRFGWQPQAKLLQVMAATLDQQALSSHGRSDLTPRNLATVLWCFGSLHYAPPNLQALCKSMEQRLGGCNAYDLSQLMYGLGAMREGRTPPAHLPASLLRQVERQACSMIASFLPQGLAQTCWSYGKLGVPAPVLLSAAVQAAVKPDSRWKGRDFTDLLWGCARLSHSEPSAAFQELDSIVCTALREHADKWSLPDLALLAWSCASLQPAAMPHVVDEIAALLTLTPAWLATARSLDVSHLLWAIAQADVAVPASLLQAFTARVRELQAELLPRERSTILWSYGKLRCYPGERLTDALLLHPTRDIQAYEPVAICNIMYACGALRHDPGRPLFQAVEGHIQAEGERYGGRDWLRILWGYGTLGKPLGRLEDAFYELLSRGNILLDGSLASMGLWAMAVTQSFDSPLYQTLAASLAHFHHSELDAAALQRIHHAHLLACSLGQAKLQDVTTATRIAAQKSCQTADAAATNRPVGAVRAVAGTLKCIGLPCTTSVATEDGHFMLHLQLHEPARDGRPIAIELVPSIKMLRNTGSFNGHVLLHLANLRAHGYAVVPICCPDWREIEMMGSPANPSDGQQSGMRHPFQSIEAAREQFLIERLSPFLPRLRRSASSSSRNALAARGQAQAQQLPPIKRLAQAAPV